MGLKTIAPVFVLFVFCLGLFLFGKGITGSVVSQSCCFPPDCTADNLCDSSDTSAENAGIMGLGVILVLVSALVFVMVHNSLKTV